MRYKVRNLKDDKWQVVELEDGKEDWEEWGDVRYQGNLADCEAWIRLEEKGLL